MMTERIEEETVRVGGAVASAIGTSRDDMPRERTATAARDQGVALPSFSSSRRNRRSASRLSSFLAARYDARASS